MDATVEGAGAGRVCRGSSELSCSSFLWGKGRGQSALFAQSLSSPRFLERQNDGAEAGFSG